MDGQLTTQVAPSYKRFVVVKTDDGMCECEIEQGKAFFHITIYKWTKASYYKMLKAWMEIAYEFWVLGYAEFWAVIDKDNTKAQRLAAMFGFYIVSTTDEHYILRCTLEKE